MSTIKDVLSDLMREGSDDNEFSRPVYKRAKREFEGPGDFCHLCWRIVPAAEVTDEVCDECSNEPD
jgi:hypothetical protein